MSHISHSFPEACDINIKIKCGFELQEVAAQKTGNAAATPSQGDSPSQGGEADSAAPGRENAAAPRRRVVRKSAKASKAEKEGGNEGRGSR